MKRFSIAGIIALVCLLPLLMAPSGGFPSRPKFQAVGVGVTAPSTGISVAGNILPSTSGTRDLGSTALPFRDLNVSRFSSFGSTSHTGSSVIATGSGTAGQIVARGTVTGVTNTAYIEFQNSAGTRIGYFGDGSSGSNDIQLEASVSGSNVNLITSGAGQGLLNGSALCSVGVSNGCLRSARVLSAGTLSGGVGAASSVRNSLGNYTVTWSNALPANVNCTVTGAQNGTPVFGTLATHTQSGTTTTVIMYSISTSPGLADGNFHMICVSGG